VSAAGSLFGVERRLPRGAFLWPAGVVAALDLRADLPEGASAPTVAALELIAAGAVAHVGTEATRHAAAAPDMPALALPAAADGAEPEVSELADAAAVPAPARARFESIYLSLSRSPAGRSLSPSVRAARALAIAAAQDGAGATADGGSAQERARAAWSVMPVVFAGGAEAAAAPEARRPSPFELTVVAPGGEPAGDEELRPGLSRLAARAGEAIGSFVRPSGAEVAQASSGAARVAGGGAERAVAEPFVHELIRTGRGFSRTGGGETEIPSWFESAARKMLEQRGPSESLSVAELTLIATAPQRQVAASTRGAPAPAMAQAPTGASGAEQGEKPDIDKIAAEVYAEILRLIDVARERNGDPWL
jgi:hypothetical protein